MCNPYISQSDCAPDNVRDVPALLYTNHPTSKHPVCSFEIPVRPRGESQSAVAAPRRRWSSSGTRSSTCWAYFIAPVTSPRHLNKSALYHGDCTWQTTKFLFVYDDHLSHMGLLLSLTDVRCRFQPAFCRFGSRPSTASNSPQASKAQAYSTLRTGLKWNSSWGNAFIQSQHLAPCLLLRIRAHTSSTRSAASAKS